jgi:hypothetical protein
MIGIFSCHSIRNGTFQMPITLKDNQIIGNFNLVELDRLDQIYLQNDQNLLVKINLNTGVKYEYFDNRQGAVDELDVYDPLNLIVFYRPYGLVKILDNTLNVIKIINLPASTPYTNVSNIAASNDGGLWLFDEVRQRIIKIDANLSLKVQSNNFIDLGLKEVDIIKMREFKNRLYLLLGDSSILVFDNFGQFIKKIVGINNNDLAFYKDQICQTNNGILLCYVEFEKAFVQNSLLQNYQVAKKILTSSNKIALVCEGKILVK